MRLRLYCFIKESATSNSADVRERDVRNTVACCSDVAVRVPGGTEDAT